MPLPSPRVFRLCITLLSAVWVPNSNVSASLTIFQYPLVCLVPSTINMMSLFLHHKDVTSYPGSASNNDFTPVSRTVVFPIGTSERPVDVQITTDDEAERDESFVLQLSNPVGGRIQQYLGETTVFIQDDDGESLIYVSDLLFQ